MREALRAGARPAGGVIDRAGRRSPQQHRDLACLGFTHLQPAQPTTVGKRACLWAYDLVLDLAEIEHRLATLKARGVKGHDRHAGQLPGTVRRRPRQGPQARRAGRRTRWALPTATPSPGRPTRARSTRRCSTRCRASPKARTRRPPTCGCCKAARSSKSRSRPIRSAPRPWPTSATRCGPNGSAGWRGS